MIAAAKKEDPLTTKAARAALNQFMQPQMNEIFFASGVILVEGEEDKAIVSRYMQISGRQAELLGKGIEIIPVNGKGNLINAISIVRGFEIPYFAIFDGDMNCAPKDKKKNVEINQTLLSLLTAQPDQDGDIVATHFGRNFCVWKDSIQDEVDDAHAWQEAKVKTAEEFGWSLDRLKKNAIVLEASLDHYIRHATAVRYETLCNRIVAFFADPTKIPATAD
jgi:predicted ATP-dependent endonuclease of OLD family